MNRGVCFRILLLFLVSGLLGCEREQATVQAEAILEQSPQVAEAIKDLSGRLGLPPEKLVLVKETSVTWRNGSMGCPKEGMMYTQALVEGALIVLRVDGKNYQYHSGKGRPPFLCENPEKPAAKAKSSLE